MLQAAPIRLVVLMQGTPELGSFSAVDLVLLFIIKAIINHVAATVTRECGQAQVYSPDHRSR